METAKSACLPIVKILFRFARFLLKRSRIHAMYANEGNEERKDMERYRLVLPKGYRPSVMFVCSHCVDIALAKIPAAHSSKLDRANESYACDARYDGCLIPAGIKR